MARSESSSTKSSTWKSPSRDVIIGTAYIVTRRTEIIINGYALNDFMVIDESHALGIMWILSGSSSNSLPLESSHSSISILVRGTQSPVKKKAHMTPMPASIPNDRKAAVLDVKLAEKATIVVTEVSITARPTLLIEIRQASSIVFPCLLSSLYL